MREAEAANPATQLWVKLNSGEILLAAFFL
jgi:hypothetical protein